MPLDTNSVITGTGTNANIDMQVDPTFMASRTNIRPLEFTGSGLIGGHFFMAAYFSNTAGQPNAALSQLFSMRWADSRMLFVLKRVAVSAAITTAFGGGQNIDYDIIKSTSYSTNPTGGSSIVLATPSQKARSSMMAGSLLATEGAIVISTGSALTAGTQVMDTQPFGYVSVCSQVGAATTGFIGTNYASLYELRDFGQHPMVFGVNEGFAIRNATAYAATGVVKAGFMIEWAEVPSY